MLPIVAILNAVFGPYVHSMERDLSGRGVDVATLLLGLTWLSSPVILIFLFSFHLFQLPSSGYFYLAWFGLTMLTIVQYTFFIHGMLKSFFHAANTFSNLAFATTILYSSIFLHEKVDTFDIGALVFGIVGALMLFDWKSARAGFAHNIGLVLVLFSVVLAPLESILYKTAAIQAGSYHEFLTGRVVMDLVYYSGAAAALVGFGTLRGLPQQVSLLFRDVSGLRFIVAGTLFHLVDSVLFFAMPVSTLTLLGLMAVPVGYAIGHFKYREALSVRYVAAAILMMVGVALCVRGAAY